MFVESFKKLSMAMLIVNAGFAYSMDIFEAVKTGDVEEVARIVNENPQVVHARHARQKVTPLHIAAAEGHVPVARVLISCGADVNVKCSIWEMSPLFKAVVSNHRPMVRFLVEHGADIEEKGEGPDKIPPFHLAAHRGQMDTLRCLVEKGVNVNAQGPACPMPLYMAVMGGQYDAAVLLVQHGAEINYNAQPTPSMPTDTPLLKAIEGGHFKIVEFLIQHGAHVNGAEATEIATKWPDYDWRADKAAFQRDWIARFRKHLDLPEDIAELILVIVGVMPPRASECDESCAGSGSC